MRYFRPTTLAEALAIRAAGNVTILAGGTDIYPARTARAGWGEFAHPDILDISMLPDLENIEQTAEGTRIGALVTWSALAEARLPAQFQGYQRAARQVGGVQVQNRGTLVGNICTASPAGDGIPNLMALDAEVELAGQGGGMRRLPIGEFITGYRQTACRRDEIVTALVVPKHYSPRSDFLKLGARSYLVISIAMVAGVIEVEEGLVASARIAVGACSAVPQRLRILEAMLLGQPIAEMLEVLEESQFDDLAPIDDIRASGAYRRAAAVAMVRELLGNLAEAPERRAA